jgi:hypothetical protein
LRLDAIAQILVADGRSFDEILHTSSQHADLIFLGIATPRENFTRYYEMLQIRTAGLPTTILVLATPEFAFTKVFTDDPLQAAG